MKLKNFRLHNKELFYFFPSWSTLPFFNRKYKNLKELTRFPADHSPNSFIPPLEEKRNRWNLLKALKLTEIIKKRKSAIPSKGSSTQTGVQIPEVARPETCQALVRVEDYEPINKQ